MTKTDLIDALNEKTGLTKKEVTAVVDAFVDVVSGSLAKGKSVEIRGFGSFVRRERAARTARNPKTGETVKVKKRMVPAFRPSKALRDRVDKK
ncbi:MAG: integration host factor subunit beta [Candidatus Eisenbacteria bacterium]|jgi:DNA-binding protein HU-beta|nr:integration host factor subunit beta [Candidatus Eisenbacteria bacterium]